MYSYAYNYHILQALLVIQLGLKMLIYSENINYVNSHVQFKC